MKQVTPEKRMIFSSANSIFSGSVILLLTVFIALTVYNTFLCDDAFITFRYAKNLTLGYGPVFNPGEHVEGYTNFLWMIIMSLVIKLNGAPQMWSRIIALCFSLGTIAVFINQTSRGNGSKKLDIFLFPALLTVSAPFFVWSSGGLETAAFAFFMFSAIAILLKAGEQSSRWLYLACSFLFLAATLTRPEGIILFALSLGYLVILVLLRKQVVSMMLWFGIPFVLLFGTYHWWHWNFFGSIFPNSYYLKTPGLHLFNYGLRYYWDFIVNSSLWIPALLVIYRIVSNGWSRISDQTIYLLVIILAYSTYVISTGGDFMALSRFLMPILAVTYLLFHKLFWNNKSWIVSRKLLVMSILCLTVFIATNIYISLDAHKIWHRQGMDSIGLMSDFTDKWTDVAMLIKESSQPSDSIAVTAAGVIPYYTELYTIDILGLVATDLSKYRERIGDFRPGHSFSIMPEYFFQLKPQFLIGHPKVVVGWKPDWLFATMQDSKELFHKYYYASSMKIPERSETYFNFWLRQDVIPRIKLPVRYNDNGSWRFAGPRKALGN